jgi:ABC-type Fe3+-siderophore transport system permease subunit
VSNQEFGNMRLRRLFAAGFAVILLGGAVLLFFADIAAETAAPPLRILVGKWTGVVVVLAGAGLSAGSAIRLYLVENRPRK